MRGKFVAVIDAPPAMITALMCRKMQMSRGAADVATRRHDDAFDAADYFFAPYRWQMPAGSRRMPRCAPRDAASAPPLKAFSF